MTTNIHNSSGYAGGAAQIPHLNALMASLVSTTNIHDFSGYAGGAAQIPHGTQLMTNLVPIRPQPSTILQDTPEALPKFNM